MNIERIRVKEVRKVNETKNANPRIKSSVLEPDIHLIQTTSLASLMAMNDKEEF